jgi:hypothetical protein
MNTALHNLRFLYEDTTLNAVPREIFESLIRPKLTGQQDFLKYRTFIMFLLIKYSLTKVFFVVFIANYFEN